MKLAPRVCLTPLPYGGAVLVNGVSLAIAECDEPQRLAINELLANGTSEGQLAQFLIATGWVVRSDAG
ncbi:actinodefensin-associated protein B [Micromonospora citrea]|uniref:actinodefensin-associated protein B n=1 Tax=Micromonospora citrea TaxID=47855 RepID=UPI00114D1AC7|nr:actinodefensin-associated protein B [Micromonospora citrea]